MKTSMISVLNEIDCSLSEIIPLYDEAVRRLFDDVLPLFPSKTAGNGDPAGGSPGGGDSMTERSASRVLPELIDLDTLRDLPTRATRQIHLLLDDVGHSASLPSYRRDPIRRLAWCRWAIRQIIAARDLVDLTLDGELAAKSLTALVVDGRLAARRWGYTPAEPTVPKAAQTELAHDPTDNWCRSCLRAGVRAERYRVELCRWCYEFQRLEQFIPPLSIVRARADKRRITEAMVAPHRPRREKPKRRRRR